MKDRRTFGQIKAEVEENLKKLDNCKKHVFFPVDASTAIGRMGKYECVNCRGQVQAGEARWYERGLRDA